MRRVEAAAEAGAAGADEERHRGRGLADLLRVDREPALGLLAPGDREGERGVGGDLAALLGRVGHRHEHADGRLRATEGGAEGGGRREVLGAPAALEREVERLEKVGKPGEGADVLAQRHEPHAQDAVEESRAPRLGDAADEELVALLAGRLEQTGGGLAVERADLHHRADLGARVHLRHRDLVDRVLLRLDPDPLARRGGTARSRAPPRRGSSRPSPRPAR